MSILVIDSRNSVTVKKKRKSKRRKTKKESKNPDKKYEVVDSMWRANQKDLPKIPKKLKRPKLAL